MRFINAILQGIGVGLISYVCFEDVFKRTILIIGLVLFTHNFNNKENKHE